MKTLAFLLCVFCLAAARGAADDTVAGKPDLDRIQGVWERVSTETSGNKRMLAEPRPLLIVVGADFAFGLDQEGKPFPPEKARLDPEQDPKALDLTPTGDSAGPLKGKTYPGIYRLDRDTLVLCLSILPGSQRPTRFATGGTSWVLDVYRRPNPLRRK